MENIADYYYDKLEKTEGSGKVLARFYEDLFNRPVGNIQDVVMFNKLVKVYGKYIPFFAILDLFSYEKAEVTDNMFGLLSYYCKKRTEQKMAVVVLNDAYKNLEKDVDKIQERIDAQKESPIRVRKME